MIWAVHVYGYLIGPFPNSVEAAGWAQQRMPSRTWKLQALRSPDEFGTEEADDDC